MLQAPASPRADTKRIFCRRWKASKIGMLWIEITPKAALTPHCSKNRVASSPTVICGAAVGVVMSNLIFENG